MKLVDGVDALDASLGRLFVVIGVFDGLHRGHLYLLDHLRDAASARQAAPAVITFDHHPDEVITGIAPPLLCDPAERLERLEAASIAVTIVQTFDVALRLTPFDEFVRRVADRVDLAGFLMTPDSAFGHDRGGTPDSVAVLGAELGYETVVVPPFLLDGEPVSSGTIRRAIASGDLATAERLLGRPVSLHGNLVAGLDPARAELRLPMPMALPPAASYQVTAEPGGAATLQIDDDGRLWLEGEQASTMGVRVRFRDGD